MFQCKLTSAWTGSGTRSDRYRPLFKDEYPNCGYSVLDAGGPPSTPCTLHVTNIPDQATADAIAADNERFPSWDWVEL